MYAYAITDILIAGRDISHHDSVLETVLQHANSYNLGPNFKKVEVQGLRLMKISWPMKISNDETCNWANTNTITESDPEAFEVHWPCRQNKNQHPKSALALALEGNRRCVRLRETLRRTTEKERAENVRTTIAQVYAPIKNADEEAEDVFYDQVQNVLDKTLKHNIVVLVED